MGRRGRLRRDRGSRGDPARPPHPSAPLGLYGRPRRSRHPAPDRGARDGASLLAGRTERRDVSRNVAHVALARVRDPARDARLYGARDGCEPRRGDAASRPRPTAESVRLHRPGRRPVRRDRRRRALGVSGGARHAARQQLDPCAARRHRHADPSARARRDRRTAAGLRRTVRRAHPAHCGDHLHLRLRPSRVFARGARPVTAPVRDAQAAHARRSRVDHRRRADLDRAPRRNRSARAPRPVSREPLQLRRPARLHRRAARRDQAEVQRTEPQASVPRAVHRRPRARAVGRRRSS